MNQTAKLKLNKPEYTDVADIADINANMDIIDENLDKALTHTHTLTDDDIKGTLPLTKGGTGATTAEATRTNLGLGGAATRGCTDRVVASSTDLITSGGVYTNIYTILINKAEADHTHTRVDLGLGSAAEKNFTSIVEKSSDALPTSAAVYKAIAGAGKRTHIVVATYDTKNPLKTNADYTCTASDASTVLKTAINSVEKGGKVELLDGTYILQYDEGEIEIAKSITLIGSGANTNIKQPASGGEANQIFKITATSVTLRDMMLSDSNESSPASIVEQSADSATYEGIFFVYTGSDSTSYNSCIKGSGDCNYTRIQNCRVYKGFSNSDKVMFDFKDCTAFSGVIGANISSGSDSISIKFANETQKNNTAVYGHTKIDLQVKA